MGKGSSPAPAPAPVDYEAQARAQMMVQQQQQAFQAQQDAAARQQALDERNYQETIRQEGIRAQQQKEQEAAALVQRQQQEAQAEKDRQLGIKNNQFNNNYSSGQNYGTQALAGLGFQDTYGIGAAYNSALENWKNQNGADIGSYTGASFDGAGAFEAARGAARDRERNKLQSSYSALTAPDWERGYFQDTADDSILEAILNEQYNDAFGTVKTAKDRGQLSDGAFTLAQNKLNTGKQKANSTLQDLGGGVLSGYRGQLSDLGRQYATTVSNWDLGNSFTTDTAKAGFDSRANDLRGRLSGDVYKAVGDTQLFDTASLMAQAGTAAGANNNPLLAAMAANNDNKDLVDDKRNTGTAGVF